jgi:hypothetical protein
MSSSSSSSKSSKRKADSDDDRGAEHESPSSSKQNKKTSKRKKEQSDDEDDDSDKKKKKQADKKKKRGSDDDSDHDEKQKSKKTKKDISEMTDEEKKRYEAELRTAEFAKKAIIQKGVFEVKSDAKRVPSLLNLDLSKCLIQTKAPKPPTKKTMPYFFNRFYEKENQPIRFYVDGYLASKITMSSEGKSFMVRCEVLPPYQSVVHRYRMHTHRLLESTCKNKDNKWEKVGENTLVQVNTPVTYGSIRKPELKILFSNKNDYPLDLIDKESKQPFECYPHTFKASLDFTKDEVLKTVCVDDKNQRLNPFDDFDAGNKVRMFVECRYGYYNGNPKGPGIIIGDKTLLNRLQRLSTEKRLQYGNNEEVGQAEEDSIVGNSTSAALPKFEFVSAPTPVKEKDPIPAPTKDPIPAPTPAPAPVQTMPAAASGVSSATKPTSTISETLAAQRRAIMSKS